MSECSDAQEEDFGWTPPQWRLPKIRFVHAVTGHPLMAVQRVQPCCPRCGMELPAPPFAAGPNLEARGTRCPDAVCGWRGEAVWWVEQ